MKARVGRVALLLVGNELLSGRVRDENLAFLASSLWALGYRVERALVVRDDKADIAAAIRDLAHEHDLVFTSGGVGPTHDDVTIAGVAEGLDRRVVKHPALEQRIRAHFGAAVTNAHLRMAEVPEGSDLVGGGSGSWPTPRAGNVYMLPGIPSILRRKFEALSPDLPATPRARASVELATEEVVIAERLGRFAAAHPELEVGSYPLADRVLVTIEGADRASVERARAELTTLLEQ